MRRKETKTWLRYSVLLSVRIPWNSQRFLVIVEDLIATPRGREGAEKEERKKRKKEEEKNKRKKEEILLSSINLIEQQCFKCRKTIGSALNNAFKSDD